MPIQKQEDKALDAEQEAASSNLNWHAPMLTVYNAEDAEANLTGTHSDH